jgi:hypothetical protein
MNSATFLNAWPCMDLEAIDSLQLGPCRVWRLLFDRIGTQSIVFVLGKAYEAPAVTDLPSNVCSWLKRVAQVAGKSSVGVMAGSSRTTGLLAAGFGFPGPRIG